MQGFITERDFDAAERMFPGIRKFYRKLADKPATFLELVWQYEHRFERTPSRVFGRLRRPGNKRRRQLR